MYPLDTQQKNLVLQHPRTEDAAEKVSLRKPFGLEAIIDIFLLLKDSSSLRALECAMELKKQNFGMWSSFFNFIKNGAIHQLLVNLLSREQGVTLIKGSVEAINFPSTENL